MCKNENDENDVKTWHPLDVVRKVGTVETQTHYSDTCTCTCTCLYGAGVRRAVPPTVPRRYVPKKGRYVKRLGNGR